MTPLSVRLIPTLLAASLSLAASLCTAQDRWPSKPVRLIVPGGPGGVIDIRARWLADQLSPALSQPIIVEPQPGAAGRIGTEAAVRSAPDGYTLLITHQGTVAVHPHLFRLRYDPVTELTPVTILSFGALVLATRADLPVSTVGEFIRLAKARPGQLTYGSPGIGTPPHLAAELIKSMANIDAVHVPYKGGGQAANDLVGGHVDWTTEGLTVLLPYVKSGRIRALGVTSAKRLPALPDVPTLAEAGIPGYEYIGWVGIAAPAATPKAIVDRLYGEIARILATARAHEYLVALGSDPGGQTPEASAAFVRAEHEKWGKLIRDAGIRAE